MSLVIKEVTQDMKCKIKEADRYIHKAIERKNSYPSLSETYYSFSVNDIKDMLVLHKEVEAFIEEYRETHNEVPKSMLEYWEFTHQELMEWIEEIKILQEFYKTL